MTIKEVSVPALTENKPLALNAPSIPAAIANGGLRWQDLNDPKSPVRVEIVLQPGAVQLNDHFKLKWQELPAKSTTVDADHLSTGVIPLDVDPADILEHADGLHTYQYFVTAAIGGQTDSSPPATVKVKRLLPGGNTGDDAGTEYINENLRAPTGIPALIDDVIAEPGITVTVGVYENMAVGDRLQFDWGGQRQTHPPLTPAEVGQPVQFKVEKATLVAAPGQVIVRYDIRDEVNNWSRWSLQVTTDVEAGENLLAAPRVVDADGGVVDLAKLGDRDVRVQTPVYPERMEAGDWVYLFWLGYTAEGVEVKVELKRKVESSDIGWPLDFDIPNDKVRAIAQGNAVVRYEVVPVTGTSRRSRRTTVEVIGQVERLPAPGVDGIVGDVLDPASLPSDGALLRIEKHALIEGGDSIRLLWDGKTASGASLPHTISIPVTGSGAANGIERRIPLIHITPLQGGSVTVSYTLTKSGGETLPSYQLPLQVKSLGAQLPKPTVDFAQGDTLDPEAVPVDGTYIRVNYDIETGDRIDVHLDGMLDFTDWFQVPANWGAKEVEFPVAKRYVDLNKDQTVKVFYIVTRGGQPLPASMEQPLLIGTAVELNAPRIKEADDNSLDPLKAKDALTAIVPAYDNMVGTQLSVTWTGTAGAGSHTTEPVQVTTQADCAVPLPNGVLAFNLNRPVTVHYTVIRNGSPKDSKPFILAVQPIAQQDPAMGRPRIMQAANGGEGPEFDVSQSTSDATISMNSWPLIALRQYVWLRLSGTNSDGSPYTQTFWQPPSSQTNQRWIDQGYYTHPIPLATLQNLKDGSELIVEFKAGLGGSQVEAEALTFLRRKYTIKAFLELTPEVTSAKGSPSGVDIPEGGMTIETAVVLGGTASQSQKIQLYDGETAVGTAVDVDGNGNWTHTVTELAATAHSFIAKALYGLGEKSAVRTFTVTAVVAPTITSVKGSPSGVEIPHGAETLETAVTLTGAASKGQTVEIFDGTTSKGRPTAGVTSGNWTLTLNGLSRTAHSITAKAIYGSGAVSTARTFTITVAAGGYENWETERLQQFNHYTPVKFKSGLEFTAIQFDPNLPCAIALLSNPTVGNLSMVLRSHSKSRFKWSGGVDKISFLINALNKSGHTVSFFDLKGGLLQNVLLPLTGTGAQTFTYQAGSGRKISYFEVYCQDEPPPNDSGFMIDEIRWGN